MTRFMKKTAGAAGPAGSSRRGGFTLIELLASMAILAVIVVMMGRIFGDAQKATRQGTREAEDAANARTVMDFIVRDIAMAANDGSKVLIIGFENIGAKDNSPWDLNTDGNDALLFVTLGIDDRGTERTAQEIMYYTELMDGQPYRYRLKRVASGQTHWPYQDWFKGFQTNFQYQFAQTLIENVRCFDCALRTSQTTSAGHCGHHASWDAGYDYDNGNYKNPTVSAFADISLILLGEDDSKTAAVRQNDPTFVNQVAKKYERRVFLYNQEGIIR